MCHFGGTFSPSYQTSNQLKPLAGTTVSSLRHFFPIYSLIARKIAEIKTTTAINTFDKLLKSSTWEEDFVYVFNVRSQQKLSRSHTLNSGNYCRQTRPALYPYIQNYSEVIPSS